MENTRKESEMTNSSLALAMHAISQSDCTFAMTLQILYNKPSIVQFLLENYGSYFSIPILSQYASQIWLNSCLGYVSKTKETIASVQLRNLSDHEIESLKQGMNRCLFCKLVVNYSNQSNLGECTDYYTYQWRRSPAIWSIACEFVLFSWSRVSLLFSGIYQVWWWTNSSLPPSQHNISQLLCLLQLSSHAKYVYRKHCDPSKYDYDWLWSYNLSRYTFSILLIH